MEFFPVYVCAASTCELACLFRSLGIKRPPLSLSTFLRPNGRFSLRNGFGVEERSMRLGLVLPPPKQSPVRPPASVLCKRRSGGSGNAPGERAGRPPIRQRKSSWKNPWETGERERKERAGERGGSGRYSSYVACRATGEEEGERMAALIVIRVWRAKRTNFMSQRTEPHPSLPPFLCPSAVITEEGLHCRTDSRIKVEKLQQAESRERG